MHRFGLMLNVALALAATPAYAEDTETLPNFAQETLTGDWEGARTASAKAGLLMNAGIKLDTLRNRGGQSNGTGSVSHIDAKLAMDLDLLGGWAGGSAMLNVISNSGAGPGAQSVGNLMGVTNIEVPYPTTTRLFQVWIQQSFLEDRAAVLVGLYPVDSEFFAMDSAGVLLGPQYGAPADLAFTRGPSLFNNSAFGLRVKLQSTDKTLYAMGALLDGIPNDPAHPRRTTIRFGNGDGSFRIGEIGWLPQAENEAYQGHAKYAAGYWAYSAKVDDQLDIANGRPPQQQASVGGYFLGEQTLLRLQGEGRFASGFARYTWTDGDSTPIENTLNIGLHLKGMLDSRPDDVLAIAWTRAKLAEKWRAAELVSNGNQTYSAETSWEISYRYMLTPYFAVQPSIQRVTHPGGIYGLSTANLIGFRLDITL